jgi:tetratricopeptide (TPR) repeat protein
MDHETGARLARIKADAESGLHAAERDVALYQALVEARANQHDAGPEGTDAAYTEAFRADGLDLDAFSAEEAATRLMQRPAAVVVELATFLDHWSAVRREARRPAEAWKRPLEVARLADTDGYRERVRALLMADDLKPAAVKLKTLAADARAAALPAATAVLLAGALEQPGEVEATVPLLRKTVSRHPGDVWANFALAQKVGWSPSRGEERVRYYTAARALRPETAHMLAHALEGTGRVEEAGDVFRDLISRRPNSAWHQACFGVWLKGRGRNDEANAILDRAIAAFRASLSLSPNDPATRVNLGHSLAERGKPDEAEPELREALRLDPYDRYERFQAHRNLANVLAVQGKHDEAIAHYRSAMRVDPDYIGGYHQIGTILTQVKRDYVGAETAFREAIRLRPDSEIARNDLAWLLSTAPDPRFRDPTGAREHARKAVELEPSNPPFSRTLALAEFRSRHWAESLAASERSMALRNGGDASDWFFLAMAHCQKGEKDEARKWFDRAVAWTKEKDPKNADLRQFWTEAAGLLGQPGPDTAGKGSAKAPAVEKPR